MGRNFCTVVRRYAGVRDVAQIVAPFVACVAVGLVVCCSAAAQPPLVMGATTNPGPVMAWGSNFWGDFGNQTYTSSTAPVAGPAGLNFAAISHGDDFSLGIDDSDTLWAWGTTATESSVTEPRRSATCLCW